MLTLTMGTDTMMSIKEVADRLDVSVMTIRRLVWAGTIKAYKIGGRLKFEPTDVEAYRAQQVYKPGDKDEETSK